MRMRRRWRSCWRRGGWKRDEAVRFTAETLRHGGNAELLPRAGAEFGLETGERSLTVAARIGAARVSKRSPADNEVSREKTTTNGAVEWGSWLSSLGRSQRKQRARARRPRHM